MFRVHTIEVERSKVEVVGTLLDDSVDMCIILHSSFFFLVCGFRNDQVFLARNFLRLCRTYFFINLTFFVRDVYTISKYVNTTTL